MEKIIVTFDRVVVEKFTKTIPDGMELEYVEHTPNEEELIAKIKDVTYLLCSPMHFITKNIIDHCPNLKLIQSIGAGYDKVDLEYAKSKGIFVCNNRGVNAVPVAEHAVLLMLACLKKLPYADREIKKGRFNEVLGEYRAWGHNELGTRTVGLIGMGAIGRVVAKILHGFGATVVYTDVVRADKEFEDTYNVKYVDNHDYIYENCDIITYHVPVLDSTKGLCNKANIAKMKKDVIIINVSRGEIVNNEDLKEALESGRVIAGLDVVAPEPPDEKTHPLLNLSAKGNENLIITPHMAGTTDDAFIRMCDWSYENMRKVQHGEKPNNIVNGL